VAAPALIWSFTRASVFFFAMWCFTSCGA